MFLVPVLQASPVRAVVEAVVEGLAEHGVLVVDAPCSLQHGVEETVTGRTVPERVQSTVQSSS